MRGYLPIGTAMDGLWFGVGIFVPGKGVHPVPGPSAPSEEEAVRRAAELEANKPAHEEGAFVAYRTEQTTTRTVIRRQSK